MDDFWGSGLDTSQASAKDAIAFNDEPSTPSLSVEKIDGFSLTADGYLSKVAPLNNIRFQPVYGTSMVKLLPFNMMWLLFSPPSSRDLPKEDQHPGCAVGRTLYLSRLLLLQTMQSLQGTIKLLGQNFAGWCCLPKEQNDIQSIAEMCVHAQARRKTLPGSQICSDTFTAISQAACPSRYRH